MSAAGWDARLVPIERPMPQGLDRFLDWQAGRWPRLAAAREGLDVVEHRRLRVGDRDLLVQFNPGRRINTTAVVDAESVRKRPCFLCLGNLPPEEFGLAFGDLVILANPAPILPGHLVLAHREHRPQRWRDAIGPLLDFAKAAQGGFTAIYNGPRSGASAPDHLHLQAVRGGLLPEEAEAMGRVDAGERRWLDDSSGRAIVGFAGSPDTVRDQLEQAIEMLDQPDINLLATGCSAGVLALLFPRAAHRPACYFAPEPERLLISPGAIDMAGVVVTVRERDLERADDDAVQHIMEQVSLSGPAWRAYSQRLEHRWTHD